MDPLLFLAITNKVLKDQMAAAPVALASSVTFEVDFKEDLPSAEIPNLYQKEPGSTTSSSDPYTVKVTMFQIWVGMKNSSHFVKYPGPMLYIRLS